MRNLKRAISLALASIMLLGMMVVGTGAKDFADANKIKNVEAASVTTALGIFEGDGDNFAPDRIVTRAEMAVLLCRVMRVPTSLVESFASTKTFTDVDTNNWSTGSIAIAAQKGWIEGDGYIKEDGMANFYPTNTVTTAEAVLMLQRALGYWNAKDESGSGNDLADANVLAYELLMMDKLTLTANAGLTRDNVAAVIYNTITNTVPVTYDSSKGYVLAHDTNKLATAKNIKDALGDDFSYSLFSAFGVNKVSGNEYADALGRPVVAWEKDGDVITFTNETADFTYTAKTDAEDIAKDMKVDYTKNKTFFDKMETALNTANTVVEIFGKDEDATVVDYTYQTASVASVKTDKDGEAVVTLNDKAKSEFVTKSTVDFEKDDIVVFTALETSKKNPVTGEKYEGDIATIAFAKTIAGEVTAKATGYIRLDGVKYEVSNAADVAIGAEGVVVLDPNGNAMTFVADVEAQSVATYAYVTGIRTETSVSTGKQVGYADMILADGSKVTVTLDMDEDNTLHVAGAPKKVYSYTVSNKLYQLEEEFATASTGVTIENGKRSFVSGVSVDFETIFVDVERGVAYTGIEEVADYTAASVSYVATEGVAEIVFITAGTMVDAEDATYVYVATTNYESSKDKNNNTIYTYTDVYVDGVNEEIVSTKNNLFSGTGLFTIDGVNTDGYATRASAHSFGAGESGILVERVTSKAIYSASDDQYFTYDKNTVFVKVDGDKVSVSSASSIIVDEDVKVGDDTCTISVVLDGKSNYAELVIINIAEKK